MNIKTETISKTTIEVGAHIHNGILKTHPCNIGDWWGEEVCQEYNFNGIISDQQIPEGEYKIIITLEKIN